MTQDTVTPEAVEQAVRAAVAAHRGDRGPLLPVLHAVVAQFGYLPPAATAVIAEELNLSRADVHGVATFYPDFRSEPRTGVVVRVCGAEACQAVGGQELMDAVLSRHPVDEVFCLGNCALGPSATVAGRLYGRLTAQRLTELIEAAESVEAADPVEPARPIEVVEPVEPAEPVEAAP